MKTLYLCGGINKLSDSDAKDWREVAKLVLSSRYTILDPMRRDFRGREATSVNEIVDGDLEDIGLSDILLVNAVRPSWGTAMEVFYAASLHKQVITVHPTVSPSPWLIRYSNIILPGFQEAFEYLLK